MNFDRVVFDESRGTIESSYVFRTRCSRVTRVATRRCSPSNSDRLKNTRNVPKTTGRLAMRAWRSWASVRFGTDRSFEHTRARVLWRPRTLSIVLVSRLVYDTLSKFNGIPNPPIGTIDRVFSSSRAQRARTALDISSERPTSVRPKHTSSEERKGPFSPARAPHASPTNSGRADSAAALCRGGIAGSADRCRTLRSRSRRLRSDLRLRNAYLTRRRRKTRREKSAPHVSRVSGTRVAPLAVEVELLDDAVGLGEGGRVTEQREAGADFGVRYAVRVVAVEVREEPLQRAPLRRLELGLPPAVSICISFSPPSYTRAKYTQSLTHSQTPTVELRIAAGRWTLSLTGCVTSGSGNRRLNLKISYETLASLATLEAPDATRFALREKNTDTRSRRNSLSL